MNVVKHNPSNWTIILTMLAENGPMPSTPIRKELCLRRRGRYHAHQDRGQYIWYFLSSYYQWGGMSNNTGLDYGYLERLPEKQGGKYLYQITEKGRQWLKENRNKTTYGCPRR